MQKIVEELDLTYMKSPDEYSSGIQQEYTWWNKTKVNKLTPYSKNKDSGYYWYFWYDTIKGKAYYLEFDM